MDIAQGVLLPDAKGGSAGRAGVALPSFGGAGPVFVDGVGQAGDLPDQAFRQGGAVGDVLFAEGEKVHAPGEPLLVGVPVVGHEVPLKVRVPGLILNRFWA